MVAKTNKYGMIKTKYYIDEKIVIYILLNYILPQHNKFNNIIKSAAYLETYFLSNMIKLGKKKLNMFIIISTIYYLIGKWFKVLFTI